MKSFKWLILKKKKLFMIHQSINTKKEDMAVSRDYLINKRMLNEDLVNQLIEQDYIKEDKMKMYVSNGKIKMGNCWLR